MVVIDDSIVCGTTLKRSILRILDRLGPRRIVAASSAPQIRYPDCCMIDMVRMGDFVASAAIALHRERGNEALIERVYKDRKAELEKPYDQQQNKVQPIYESLTEEETAAKISELLTPADMGAEVRIIFQSVPGLHDAIPAHRGDWYFTGNFPTPVEIGWPIALSSTGRKGGPNGPIDPETAPQTGHPSSPVTPGAGRIPGWRTPHHHRPARFDSPGNTGRVHGAHPMLGYPMAYKVDRGPRSQPAASTMASSPIQHRMEFMKPHSGARSTMSIADRFSLWPRSPVIHQSLPAAASLSGAASACRNTVCAPWSLR